MAWPGVLLFAGALLAVSGPAAAGERYRIANEGTIGKDWALADGIKLTVPGYPAALAERGDNVCVALGYAINPDGTTSDFTVLKSWSSGVNTGNKEPANGYWDAFAQASANAVSQWRFKSREPGVTPRATYTVVTVSFSGKQAMDAASLRSQCAIGDLASVMQEQRASAFMSSREKQDMENANRHAEQRQLEQVSRALERSSDGQ